MIYVNITEEKIISRVNRKEKTSWEHSNVKLTASNILQIILMTSRKWGTKYVLFIFFCLLLSSLHHTTQLFQEAGGLFPGKWPLLQGRQMAAAPDKPSSPPWPCVTQKPWRSLCWTLQVSSWIWVTGSTKPCWRHPRVTQTHQGPFLISVMAKPALCNCNDLSFRAFFFLISFYYYFLFSPCSL